MAFSFSQPRKILPVDVLEEDGLYTRGYVQDLLDTGDCVVFFDCELNPSRVVSRAHVFKVRTALPWSRARNNDDDGDGSGENDDSSSSRSITLSPDNSDDSRPSKVDVLIRWSPSAAKRWYTGVMTRDRAEIIVDIEKGPPGPCKSIFDAKNSVGVIQPAAFPRDRDEVTKIEICIPDSVRLELANSKFIGEWERQTNALIKSLDLGGGVMTVVLNESNPLSPVGYFRRVTATLRKGNMGAGGRKRSADFETDGASQVKKWKLKHGATTTATEATSQPQLTGTMPEIPELLVKIFRHLDLPDRLTLRGVCSLWKNLMESSEVTSTLYLHELAYTNTTDYTEERASFVDRFRYFTPLYHENLTSVCIQCTVEPNVICGVEGTFLDILCRMGSTLAPSLKSIVLTGKLDCSDLIEWVRVKTPLQVGLRNMTLYCLDCFGEFLEDMHLPIKSADLIPPDVALTETDDDERKKAKLFLPYERCGNAWDWMRNFLSNVLDLMPLDSEEEKAILDKVAAAEEQCHLALVGALYYSDRKYFNPAMLRGKKKQRRNAKDKPCPEETKIRVVPLMLRKATLHLFRAVLMNDTYDDYTCGDTDCVRKHGSREKSVSLED